MLSVFLRSFIFGPFLPVLFGATNSERTCSRRLHERRGITHSPPSWASGALAEGCTKTERSEVKEAWGYPSGGGRAQVGRPGRQAKRCPNMRAGKTEETTRL